MSEHNIALKQQRDIIDKCDDEILSLLHKRVKAVKQIGLLKEKEGSTIYRPDREKLILNRLLQKNQGHAISDSAVETIFTEIISACRSLEGPLHVSCLGPAGTFTQSAVMKQFGRQTEIKTCKNIADVFYDVETGKTDIGLVPIENSTEGIVNSTLDLLQESNVYICAEIYLTIHQNLMSLEKTYKNIKTVISHPQALAQCRKWLEDNLPAAELKEVASTAEAAKYAAEHNNTAAIGSGVAAETYHLKITADNIEDNADNRTRFIIFSKTIKPRPTGNDKTSIQFSLTDKPGALLSILQKIYKNKINMSKIDSRPSQRKPFEYSFFIDIEGHQEDKAVKACLQAIKKSSTFLKILGSYPAHLREDER